MIDDKRESMYKYDRWRKGRERVIYKQRLCLDRQFSTGLVFESFSIRGQCGFDMFDKEAIDLLRSTANEGGGIQKSGQFFPDRFEVFSLFDTLDQVVFTTFHLDDMSSLMRQDTDFFVAFLTITTLLHHSHDDVFGGHEGQFLADTTFDDLGVDDHTFKDVLQSSQEDIGGQEGFGERDTTDGAIVQSTFEPLDGTCLEGIVDEDHQVAGQGAHTFASHRVTLVGHGRATNLVLFKRFFDFLEVGQQTDIGGDLVASGTKARERVEDVNVDLARVGLTTHRVGFRKSREFSDELI